MEDDRRKAIDTPNESTRTVPIINKVPKDGDEKLAKLEELYKKAGLDPTKAKERLKIRASLGLNNFDPKAEED